MKEIRIGLYNHLEYIDLVKIFEKKDKIATESGITEE